VPAGVRAGCRLDQLVDPFDRAVGTTTSTVTLSPGAARPAGLAVVDLRSVAQLQARFNVDQGMARLVLALAPT